MRSILSRFLSSSLSSSACLSCLYYYAPKGLSYLLFLGISLLLFYCFLLTPSFFLKAGSKLPYSIYRAYSTNSYCDSCTPIDSSCTIIVFPSISNREKLSYESPASESAREPRFFLPSFLCCCTVPLLLTRKLSFLRTDSFKPSSLSLTEPSFLFAWLMRYLKIHFFISN